MFNSDHEVFRAGGEQGVEEGNEDHNTKLTHDILMLKVEVTVLSTLRVFLLVRLVFTDLASIQREPPSMNISPLFPAFIYHCHSVGRLN